MYMADELVPKKTYREFSGMIMQARPGKRPICQTKSVPNRLSHEARLLILSRSLFIAPALKFHLYEAFSFFTKACRKICFHFMS
jgi:hypothetical protein